MRLSLTSVITACLFTLLAARAHAQTVTVTPTASHTGAAPGGQLILAVTFDIAPGYHIQPNQPHTDWQIPTTVELIDLPEGIYAGDIQWPPLHPALYDAGNGPEPFDFFIGKATVFIKLSVSADTPHGQYPFTIKTLHQACDDVTCELPETIHHPFTLLVTADAASITTANTELFEQYTGVSPDDQPLRFNLFGWSWQITPSLGALLAIAALGGFLLNFTPCVLPMIPIKVLGFSKTAEHKRGAVFLGGVMSLGVVAFWLGIGVAISMVTGFDAVNELFQYTEFNIIVGLLIVLMGLGVFGLFTARLPQWVYRINPTQDTIHGSFGFGIMTAVLSTPCTAPFMGTAAAWAAKQTPAVTLAVFAAIGLGMALPYFLLTVFPKLLERLPRTGPASELIKRVMGLLMIAAGCYFLGTGISSELSTPPDPASKLYWLPVFGFIAAAGVYLATNTFKITRRPVPRVVFGVLGTVTFVVAVTLTNAFIKPSPVNWIYYTPERLAQARDEGKTIVLDFTADWCLNCHALEHAILNHSSVYTQLNADHVAPFKVDITRYEPAQQLLSEVGSATIPLFIIEDPAGNSVFRADNYTRRQVIDALQSATPGS